MIYKTKRMQEVEERLGKDLVVFLKDLYIEQGKTMRDISSIIHEKTGLEVLPGVLSRWFKDFDIPARKAVWEVK